LPGVAAELAGVGGDAYPHPHAGPHLHRYAAPNFDAECHTHRDRHALADPHAGSDSNFDAERAASH
jgi:hypothetical protein